MDLKTIGTSQINICEGKKHMSNLTCCLSPMNYRLKVAGRKKKKKGSLNKSQSMRPNLSDMTTVLIQTYEKILQEGY